MQLACTKCGLSKPSTEFYRKNWQARLPHTRQQRTTRDYHWSWCKACKSSYDKTRRKVLKADSEWLTKERKRQLEHYKVQHPKYWEWRQAGRARRAGSSGFVSWDEWQTILKAHENKCHWCRCDLHVSFLTLDHVTPLSKGGQHNRDNVVPACMNCNNQRKWYEQTKYPELYQMPAIGSQS